MAVAEALSRSKNITYADYMSEGEVNARYDIIDGTREFMTNPSTLHQIIAGNVYMLLHGYQRAFRKGRAIIAPADILISQDPLRTRQPDVLFISSVRFGARAVSDPSALSRAPELVVEVLSPTETRTARMAKVADYCKVDVRECWLISPEAETLEVLSLSLEGSTTSGVHGRDTGVTSLAFPDLVVSVAEVFNLEL